MAKILSKSGISALQVVKPGHVTQSIDAFTGIEAYDISLSGSFTTTGSLNIKGPSTFTNGSITASVPISMGPTTIANGISSFSQGSGSKATGDYSNAHGRGTRATGFAAHAEGLTSIAEGSYSHAEGRLTIASGDYAHTEGHLTTASGDYSNTSGYGTIASGNYQLVAGQFNTPKPGDNSSLIIGNGVDTNNRSNILFAGNNKIELNAPVTASSNISASGIVYMTTASIGGGIFTSASLAAGGGGSSAETNFTQSLFVTPSGNNGTAIVGDMLKPFQTILAATASANVGDTIIVYPGTYTADNANIIKDGVNYYFYAGAIVHPTASLSGYIVDIEDPTHPVNVRGAGSFISDDTNYGAIRIQAKECYFEFDTAKTTNNTTSTFNQGGTVDLEPTNTDGVIASTELAKGNPFYVKGDIVNTGNFGTYAGALVFGRNGIGTKAMGTFEGSVMQLHPTDTRPAIFNTSNNTQYTININANVFASGSEAVLVEGRGYVNLKGTYATGDRTNKYAISMNDAYQSWYNIDADINGSIKLNTGDNLNSGGMLRGTQRTAQNSPDDAAIYINGGGQHKIDNQIFLREYGAYGIKIDTDDAQVEFTGDFNADAASSQVNFCKVTTGKLIFKGSLGSNANRGAGNVINGGHLVIDSFFDNDGSNSPNNSFCFVLSAGTLEINDKVTHKFTTTGSGFVDMTGGYLQLNGVELVQLSGTGSFANCIKLTGGQTGSFFNNSFTNLNVFNDSTLFLNEMSGSGSLFYTDRLR